MIFTYSSLYPCTFSREEYQRGGLGVGNSPKRPWPRSRLSAEFAPQVSESAGGRRSRRHRAQLPLTWLTFSARPPSTQACTETFFRERYQRIARVRGKSKAIFAVGWSIVVITWHLLCHLARAMPTWAPASTKPASAAAPGGTTSVSSMPSA
jgi:hypothetical protein